MSLFADLQQGCIDLTQAAVFSKAVLIDDLAHIAVDNLTLTAGVWTAVTDGVI